MWHRDAYAVKAPTLSAPPPMLLRPVPVALGLTAVLTLAAWTVLLAQAWRREAGIAAFLGALCSPGGILGARSALEGAAAIGLAAGLWVAMSVAMMLPTASAFLVGYAEIAEERGGRGHRTISPIVPALGYLASWAAVSVLAALAQAFVGVALTGVAIPAPAATILAGAGLGAAGLYQFSPTKLACLTSFRDPTPLLREFWAEDVRGVLRLGVAEGMRCFRSCWALMAVMLAIGAMNLIWMALFSALIAAEKLSGSARFARGIGVAFLAAGTALSLSAVGLARLLAFGGF
ncbi:DUF2182 domain-containing protein [Salinarimonas soli]|uniref:DUF2182 domain-containing protein n=1 Tax=Salinarimonas soli TaxID=1638099 RepID=A0A5B2VN63_9HYPH|nr:DUF2182 domain-containing protein [Salinarimonas soli]KAA2241083.1 DUF2182 domain-containing protein [Salinarimonas soli]